VTHGPEAASALGYAGEQPPPQAAAQADALAEAVLEGKAVPPIEQPPAASPAMRALYAALHRATDVIAGGRAAFSEELGGAEPPRERQQPLLALATQFREGLATTFAIRLMLCIGVATVASEVLPLQRSYWVVLAVAVVMKPDFGSVFARTVQYSAGTVIGALIAAAILAAGPPDAALLVPMALFAALMPYGMSRNYGLFGIFFTPLVVLLIDLLSHDGWSLAEDRLIDILFGCGIVLCLGYVLWPSSWHANLPRDLARALDEAAAYLEQALTQPAARAAATHARSRRKNAALRTDFQRALAEPQRLRERVTAWWPAIVALEQVLEAVTATAVTAAEKPPPAPAVGELAAGLRRSAALVRSGTPVPPDAQLPTPPTLVSDAVRSLQEALAHVPPQPRQPLTARISPLAQRPPRSSPTTSPARR
jgi:uncharacterized membrane protein YccC